MTNKEKEKILKYIEEFELVNPTTGDVYVEKDVYMDLTISKTGKYVYIIIDSEGREIGKCPSKKAIELNSKYKERKQKEIDGKEFDFDEDLEVDIDEMLQRQQEKEEMENAILADKIMEQENEEREMANDNNKNENDKNDKKQDVEKNELENKQNEEKQNQYAPISQEELKEQGYNVLAYSLIKDENIINSLVVDDFDPRSVIVAEDKGQIKFLAREVGTGNIKELPQAPTSTSGEHVNEFSNGQEKDSIATNKVRLANCPGIEFSVDKNKVGQLEIYCIDNIDKEGDREAIPVKTQAVHPTIEEYKRTVSEKYKKYGGFDFKDIDDREEEIKARLADEKESIRDEVYAEIEEQEELPDNERLEEIIEKKEIEQEEEELEQEENENAENEEKSIWDLPEHDLYKKS